MVYQATNNVIDVKVCSISFQRHTTSLLIQQKNQRNLNGRRLNPRAIMAENQTKQQQLPVVEIRPFVKKVWRREKSLPDFYDKKTTDEHPAVTNSKGPSLEISPSTSRLVRELTETRRSMETRQNTMDSSLGKYRSHPKAEFSHKSTKTWRKQDLIPSFITRFERTKTSMESLSKESSSLQQRLTTTNVIWDNFDTTGENSTGIKVKGGKMSQHIHRRHLLYLNPLESYRQPNSWGGHFSTTDNSRHCTGRHHLAPSRDSFPLSSGRAKELLLSGWYFNHPLKPIQREDMESPHKFNSKLGAAKSSLQILNRMGAPTKLEKALEKEYKMNLERFRKDRLFLPHDLKTLSNNYVHFDSNPTIGETFLRNAREANKSKKRLQQGNEKMLGLVRQDTDDWYPSDMPVPDIQRVDTHLVNQSIHPINTILHEESEIRFAVKSVDRGHNAEMSSDGVGNSEPHKVLKTCPQPANDSLECLQLAPPINADASDSNDRNTNRPSNSDKNVDIPSIGSLNPCQNNKEIALLQDESTVAIKITNDNGNIDDNNNNDNNSNSMPSTDLNSPIDSSRLETNIDYLDNLQRKSRSSFGHEPTPRVTDGATNSTSRDSAMVNNQKDQALMGDNQTTTRSVSDAVDAHDQIALNPIAGITSLATSSSGHTMEANSKVNKDVDNTDTAYTSAQEILPSSSERTDVSSDSENRQGTSRTVDSGSSEKTQNDSLSLGSLQTTGGETTSTEASPQRRLEGGRNVSQKANSVVRSSAVTSLDPKQMPLGGNYTSNNGVSINSSATMESEIVHNERVEQLSNVDGSSLAVMEMVISQNQLEITGNQSRGLILEDEGISMATTIEAAVLDSSMTEVSSDPEGVMSGCADNGDSCVSTTFITVDESRPKELEGLMV